MADTIGFNEGKDFLLQQLRGASGITTVHFLLSSKDTATLVATDTLAGGVAEVTGWTGGATPYARISQTVPAPSNGIITFSPFTWATDTATNGPASVKSVIMVANTANKALFAWNINAGGSAVAMNTASASLQFTPTFFLQNVGGG